MPHHGHHLQDTKTAGFETQSAPINQTGGELIQVVKEIFIKLKENDTQLKIFPWDEDDSDGDNRLAPLQHPDKVPKLLADFKWHFLRAWPTYDGGLMYTSIWVWTSTPMPKLVQSIRHWLNHEKYAILPQQLHCQATHTIGWLAYSDYEINCPVLAKAIKAKVAFDVKCQWRVISIGEKGLMTKEERVQAIHLLVDDKCRDEPKTQSGISTALTPPSLHWASPCG
ncbi:hypothetical protein ACA910_003737 [Epithemia clementina (nom. ined.)]